MNFILYFVVSGGPLDLGPAAIAPFLTPPSARHWVYVNNKCQDCLPPSPPPSFPIDAHLEIMISDELQWETCPFIARMILLEFEKRPTIVELSIRKV